MKQGIRMRWASVSLVGLCLLSACGGVEDEPGLSSVRAGLNIGGTYTLVGMQSGKCVDVTAFGLNDGDNVQLWSCSGNTNQRFRFEYVAAGYYQFVNVNSGKCLDVWQKSIEPGANVVQYTCNGGANQQWKVTHVGTGGAVSLTARNSGLALEAWTHGTTDGTKVAVWTYTGAANQLFYLNEVDGGPLADRPDGFASTSGSGLSTTTGGGTATPSQVTTCDQLRAALTDTVARVITIPSGTHLDCRTAARSQVVCYGACGSSEPNKKWYRLLVPGQTCADLGAEGQTTLTRNETSISVTPNKTLLGLGSGATLSGVVLNLSNTSNIIIRNLTLQNVNPHLIEAGDGVTINNSHHIWLDHLRIRQVSDGYVDVTSSNHVTISKTHFDGRNSYVCGGQHHYIMLVGGSQVSLHHNYFDATSGRNPKVDGSLARAHVYNNYYNGVSYFCLASTNGAQALVEGNYFNNSRYPHWRDGGYVNALSNSYAGTSTESTQKRDTGDSVLKDASWYNYSLDSSSNIPSIVTSDVGPRTL